MPGLKGLFKKGGMFAGKMALRKVGIDVDGARGGLSQVEFSEKGQEQLAAAFYRALKTISSEE